MLYKKNEIENECKETAKKDQFNGYVMFDFECFEGPDKNHIVNLALAQEICVKCLDFNSEDRCNECQIIHRFGTIDQFCIWSLKQSYTIQIAHNLKEFFFLFLNYFSLNIIYIFFLIFKRDMMVNLVHIVVFPIH